MKLLGVLAVLMVVLVVAGVATSPDPVAPRPVESMAVLVPDAVPARPEAEYRWVLDPVEHGEGTGVEPVGPAMCDHEAGPSARGVVRVYQVGLHSPVDLRGLPGALAEHAPGVHLEGPIPAIKASAAYRHSNPWTVVLVVTHHPLFVEGERYAGWGCTGHAVIDPGAYHEPCLWGLALHEVGHAWGYEHQAHGLMNPEVTCQRAREGYR